MTKLDRILEILCAERGEDVPALSDKEKGRYFRALVNVRMPKQTSAEFLRLQDEYLQEELQRKGVTDIAALSPMPLAP
ncbi:MAG: protein-ADP-ribose hydrolase, partial [Clostridiales bacterium]|nr:protein-ADP-ribose hydrolase [Clostridiales bacterium]